MQHPNEGMIIVRISDGKAVAELYNSKLISKINYQLYKVVPASEYLAQFNHSIQETQ